VLPVSLTVTARLIRPALSPRIDNPRKETAMKNPDEFLASYNRYRKALNQVSQSNKAVIFDALVAGHITEVHVEFDGCGDSGQIECMTAYRGEEKIELPIIAVTLQQVSWGDIEVRNAEEKLPQAIETLCYDYLEETNDGWENNDGAFGEFHLDVAERTVELEFHARYTATLTENHTF
jgi:hypothetical protein